MARIGVIGAGIIGAAVAIWLVGEGHVVTVFEPDPDGSPSSTGNAGLIALPEIAPMASLGMLSSVPGWLLDPLGPLTLRWQDVPALMPWLIAFLASAEPRKVARSRDALRYLMQSALADHERLAGMAGLSGHLRQTGFLSLHDSAKSLNGALSEAAAVQKVLGYPFESLSVPAARAMVPQLEGEFAGAVHQPGYWMVSHPLSVLRHYQNFLRQRAELLVAKASRITPQQDGIAVWSEGQSERVFDKVVVAAGIWSRTLVRGLGAKVLLENERGYNTTFTDLGWNLAMPVGFADHGFVATPLVGGLRVGGAVELARPDTSPNFKRASAMRAKMRRYVPSLPDTGEEWMGRRPSTPDSLPVIGQQPGEPRIVHAFGHGHLGLTLSAVTARLVAGLVGSGPVDPGIERFSLSRFQ